jgi:outer membrane protein OmpA-like peptidoglycan-associated protein
MSTRIWSVPNGLLAFCLAWAAALFVNDARAQFYIGAEGGWTGLPSQTITVPGLFSTSLKFNSGFNAGARLGYEWGPWRFEEEYSYRQNGIPNSFSLFGLPINGISGNRHTNSIMTNVLYDFTLGAPITPHFGFGVGAVNIHDGVRLPGIGQFINDSTWQFGYQGIAGIRYNLGPTLTLDLDYRYLATTQPTFRILNSNLLRYRSGYNTNNFVASIIYRFASPPPPLGPVTEPATPPTAQVFLVFFDWDRADITPAGLEIIKQAANVYKAGGSVHLEVAGYTDLSGSPGYNQRLSIRRANNVANALATLGVARSDMAVSGRGESDPRVPTPAGVREPQNRRVEINVS